MANIVGERIRARRKELKITQTQIQQKTSISSGHLSCIENGKYLPSASALLELSKVLDCSIDWILTGQSSAFENSLILDNEEKELLNGFRKLAVDDQEELLCLLRMKLRKLKKEKNTTAKSSPSVKTETDDMVG